MDRITNDVPNGEFKNALNLCYIEDSSVMVRGGGEAPEYKDVPLTDYIRSIVRKHNLEITHNAPDEDLIDELYEYRFDGTDTLEGIISTLNTMMWVSATLRERLKQYEDIGLTPEEVKHFFAGYLTGEEAKAKYRDDKQRYDEWAEWKKAESEGRLKVLPCKVGDKVRDKIADYVFTVELIEIGRAVGTLFRCGNPGTKDYMAFYAWEIGENIEILTREEEEAVPEEAQ